MVLLAFVHTNYKFIYVDVGCSSRVSDGGVFQNSSLSTAIESKMLNVPSERIIVDEMQLLLLVTVAYDAFPLRNNLMKPYLFRYLSPKKKFFNYRLSRTQRTAENAFEILAYRLRFFITNATIN